MSNMKVSEHLAWLAAALGALRRLERAALAGCICLAVLVPASSRAAADDPPLRLVRSWTLTERDLDASGSPPATQRLRLEIVMMQGAGWSADRILDATKRAARILAQCGIRTTFVELAEFDGPTRYRHLDTPVSRELARRVRLAPPAIFFVADTLNRPAFDAEAIGRGNSRSRPELTDTVWITAGTRDLPNVIAHELSHVLANSGEHSDLANNLMRDESASGSTVLTTAQCWHITEAGAANGLLQPAQQ
jgi:hypothetical protein